MKNFILPFLLALIPQAFFIFAGYEKAMGQNPFKKHIINNAEFEDSVFTSSDFQNTAFVSAANFSNAEFNSKANFRNANFDSDATFYGSEFDSTASFHYARFYSANFNDVKFHSEADFNDANFRSGAYFRKAKFNSATNFFYAKFYSTASFEGANFNFTVNFDKTLLPDTIDFRHVTEINKLIDFTLAKLNSPKKTKNKNYKCQIALMGSDLSKIKINYELFQLWLPEKTNMKKK